MPRISKVEPCMFCGELPCVCGKPIKVAKPVKPKRAPRPDAPKATRSPERPSNADRMRAGVSAHEARRGGTWASTDAPPAPSVSAQRSIPTRTIEDLVEEDCLRTLAPLLHADEVLKHKMVLTSEPSPAERAAVWRWRRSNGTVV